MTSNTEHLEDTLIALRREFDDAFAAPPRMQAQAMESLLAIRMLGEPYALRVGDIAGLHADRRILPMPAQSANLLGVASFRGRIAPVYDLASLCGYAPAPAPRWLVLLRSKEPLALAFDAFEKHFSVSPLDIIAAQGADGPGNTAGTMHRAHAVRDDGVVRPIIQLQSVLADIVQRCEASHQPRSLTI